MEEEHILIRKNHKRTSSNVQRKNDVQKIFILQYIYLQGSKTNNEICEAFNISSPTSIRLLNQLIEEGWMIKEGRGKSAGGRKPELYGLKKDCFFVLGIQVERFNIKIAIFDNHNKKRLELKNIDFRIEEEASVVDFLFEKAQLFLEESEIEKEKLLGIGISMPGLVSSQEGKNFTYFLKEEESESLENLLVKKFKKPVYILNDAKSAGLAEFYFGQAKQKQNVLVISMDWGIGLGIIIDGKMYHGSSGFAGEFGHIPLIDDGPLCICGKRGCLETVASGMAITRIARERIKARECSVLGNLSEKELERLQPESIINAAIKGDQFCIEVLSDAGINLGKGIAILIQLFNPELIILEGKFAEAKEFITTPVQQSINTCCMSQLREKTLISLSKLGDDTVLLGSVATVMDKIFENQMAIINTA